MEEELQEAKRNIESGDFLAVERIAQDAGLPEEIRKDAGMKHIENSIKSGRWTNLVYILGSRRFLEQVSRAAGMELINEGKYLELLAKGEMYSDEIRESAGEKIIAKCKKEKNMRLLERIAYMRGYPGKTRENAREALDTMKAIRMRKETLNSLKQGNDAPGRGAAKKAATA